MSFVAAATFLGIDVASAAALAGVDLGAADLAAGIGAADIGAAGLGTAGLTGLADTAGFGAAADAAAATAAGTGLASGLGGVGVLGGLAGTGADLAGTIGATLGAPLGVSEGFGALADTAAADAAATGLASGTSSIPDGLSTAFPTDLASLALQPGTLPGSATTGVSPSTFGGTQGAAAAPVGSPVPATAAPAGPSAATAAAPAGVTPPISPDPTSVFTTGAAPVTGAPAAPVAPTASLAGGQSPGITSLAGTGGGTGGDVLSNFGPVTQSAGGGGSFADTISGLGTKALDSITKNPLGTALGVGGLGYSIYTGQKLTSNEASLKSAAQQAAGQGASVAAEGQSLTQYLQNGTLPPAYQAQIDQAINSQIQAAISAAAAAGQPTDPTKNTSLAATIANIQNQKPILQSELASQLASSGEALISSGLSATGLSGQLYQTLVSNDTQAAANTGKAIANLAAALNGKSGTSIGGITISQAA